MTNAVQEIENRLEECARQMEALERQINLKMNQIGCISTLFKVELK